MVLQVEATSLDVLVDGASKLQVESTGLDVLVAGDSKLQVESSSLDVLADYPNLQTSISVVGTPVSSVIDASSASRTITIPSDPPLQADDVIFIIARSHRRTSIRAVTGISGLGTTFGRSMSGNGQELWLGRFAEGSSPAGGNLTMTWSNFHVNSFTAFVVRGLPRAGGWFVRALHADLYPGDPIALTLPVGAGELVIGGMHVNEAGGSTYYPLDLAPTDGWVLQGRVSGSSVGYETLYRIPSAERIDHSITADNSVLGFGAMHGLYAIGLYQEPSSEPPALANVKVGSLAPTALKVGTMDVVRVYQGNTLLFGPEP